MEVCNYLRAHADNCFIDIYTEAEKQANPDLHNTGLFFFRGNSNAPFAICNAGGGFSYVGAMHDSFPHALELSKQGYNAFALIYRPGDAYEDLARAITYICDHADELGVQRDGYSLWGGSAGARMAATLGNSANLRSLTGRTDLPQASAVVMQYTGYTTVSPYDGPTYACCGTSDGIASWRTMQSRLESLSALGIPTEFHSYNGLPHGFGLGTGTVAEGWLQDAVHFWQSQSGATAIHSAKANTKPSDTIYSLNGIRHNSLQPGVNIVDGTEGRNPKIFRETAISFAEFFTFQPLKLLDLKTFCNFAAMKAERTISAYKNYFRDFISSLTEAEARTPCRTWR